MCVCVAGWGSLAGPSVAGPSVGPPWLWHPPTRTVNSGSPGHQAESGQDLVAATAHSRSLVPFSSVSLLKQECMKCDIFLLGSPREQAIYEDLISIPLFLMTGTGPPQSGAVSFVLAGMASTPRPPRRPRAPRAGPAPKATLCLYLVSVSTHKSGPFLLPN